MSFDKYPADGHHIEWEFCRDADNDGRLTGHVSSWLDELLQIRKPHSEENISITESHVCVGGKRNLDPEQTLKKHKHPSNRSMLSENSANANWNRAIPIISIGESPTQDGVRNSAIEKCLEAGHQMSMEYDRLTSNHFVFKEMLLQFRDCSPMRPHHNSVPTVARHRPSITTSSTISNAARTTRDNVNGYPAHRNEMHLASRYWLRDEDNWDEDRKSLVEKITGVTVVNESSAFSPLTETAKKRLRKYINEPNLHVELRNIDGCSITVSNLQCLKAKTWLNDEIINSYMQLLLHRSERGQAENKGFRYPKMRVINSFFYSKLFAERGAYDFSGVRRWTKLFHVTDYDLFIVPINAHGNHWTLGVIDFKAKQVEHYDSFGGFGSDVILLNLLQWVKDEMEFKSSKHVDIAEWRTVPMASRIPQQNNHHDCGVFVCKFADFRSRNAAMTFGAQHMLYFRARIAHELLVGRVA